jgi:uncharacterized membrane protein YccC
MNTLSILVQFTSHHKRLTHIIKFTLAFLFGWLITLLFPQSRAQWIMISIAVVMGSSTVMGLQFNKALLRASGTLLGGCFGLITFLAPNNQTLYLSALCSTAIFFSWFSQRFEKKNYVASLGMVTFFIITYNSNHSLAIAGLRVIDTIIGISISLIISKFVFPVTSQNAIHRLTQDISITISHFIQDVFIERQERRNNPKFLKMDSHITDSMLKQRNIIDALMFSSKPKLQLKKSTMSLLRFNRAIYHYILFIDTALWENRLEQVQHTEEMQIAIQPFMQLFSDQLKENNTEVNKTQYITKELYEKITYFTTHLQSQEYTNNEKERQHAIQFAMRRMIYCLAKITKATHQLCKIK